MKKLSNTDPVDTGRPGRLLNVICTFSLRPVSMEDVLIKDELKMNLADIYL